MRNAMWVGGGITGMGEIPMLGVREKGIAKVIRDIFRSGEQGFFYDPSDLKTQFQDIKGTVPVTAAGQPLGLLLDKSKGLRLGPNIAEVTTLVGEGIGGGPYKQTTITNQLVIGKRYKVSIKVSNYSGTGEVGIEYSVFRTSGQTISKDGVITLNAVAEISRFNLYTKTSNNADFSEITIQELHGNHAYQDTSAARPILQNNPKRVAYDGVDDKLITKLPTPLTNATVLRAIPNVGTQVKYNQTLPMVYEDATNHSGLIAIDRALTRTEQLRLMTELDKKAGATSFDTSTFRMFDSNQEGFVYDPNDLSTLYQDSEGKTPVTAAGQPVGLILDKRKGSAVGANLHTAATPINTTLYPGIGTRSGLDITVSQEASGYSAVSLGMPTVVGKTYLLELIAPNSAGFWVLVADSATSDSINRKAAITSAPASRINTKISLLFTATASVSYIHLNRGIGPVEPATFKEVSVREVLGNHAYQTTSASRPILRQNAVTGAYYLEFDGTDDFLQITVALPYPVTAVAPFDFKSGNTIKCVLSAGASGYLRSTETAASVHSTSGSVSIAKKKVDVLLHELTGDSVNIRTNSDAIAIRNTDNKNPYVGVYKYIGSFSDTHTTLRPAMDLYGMVVIRKLLTTSEEAEIRAHFNKRMGI